MSAQAGLRTTLYRLSNGGFRGDIWVVVDGDMMIGPGPEWIDEDDDAYAIAFTDRAEAMGLARVFGGHIKMLTIRTQDS